MTPGHDSDDGGSRPGNVFGPEWVRRSDGKLYRAAARVLLLDTADRLLLVRGHDVDNPQRSWWFTIGGGIEAGENPREAAVRELAEETGLRVAPEEMVGPVLTRSAEFDFFTETVRQDEEFFLARVAEAAPIVTDGWTEVERGFMDEARWWDLDELAAVDIEVFPAELAAITRDLMAGWDGQTRHLGLARE